jgi:hypothetical protein
MFVMTELEKRAKVRVVVLNVIKVLTLIGLLYIFVCSLDLLASAFRLLAARQAGACTDWDKSKAHLEISSWNSDV